MSLFTGTKATSYTTQASETPKWMQDAIFSQIQSASNVANMPYEAYSGPRVAGLAPQQEAAYKKAAQDVGSWLPTLNQAMTQTGALGSGMTASQAALPYIQQAAQYSPMAAAQGYLAQGLGGGGLQAASPYAQQQTQLLGRLNYNVGTENLAPYVQQAVGQSGLAAASPYMQQAAQTSAQDIGQFMNPYNEAVTSQIARLGARNLSENLLPNVSDAFVRAGQFGGTRMGEFGARAVRDTQEAILAQQAQALQSGYGQAVSAAQQEAARQAQLASTAGGLGSAQQQALLSAGQALAGAGQQGVAQALSGAGQYGQLASAMGGLGSAQQQAFLTAAQQAGSLTGQQAQQLANLAQLSGQLSSTDVNRQLAAQQQLGALAQTAQQLNAQDRAALEAAGSAYQTQQQREIDAARQAFAEAQAYPRQTLDWLSTQIRGMAPITPQTVTSTTTGNTGLSPLSQLAAAGTAAAGLSKLMGS